MKYYRLNNQIISPQVCLIDENGKFLGNIKTGEAVEMARQKGLDLLEIGPKANPPVAKIIDFKHFKYELKRKDRQQKKQQKIGLIKGIRLTPRIGKHDIEIQVNKAKKFLSQKQKVKIDMILRGREKAHFDLAEQKIKDFIELLGEVKIEQFPKKMGGTITTLVSQK